MTTSSGVELGDYKEEFIKKCDDLISRYQKFFKEAELFFSEDVFNKKIDAPLIWGRAMRPRWLGDDLERSVNLLARQDVYIYGGDFERFNNIPAMAEVGLSNVFSAKNQCISSGRCNLKYLERSIRCLAELEMFCELSKKYISAIDRRVKKEKSLHGKKAGNKNAVRYDAVREEIKRRVVEYCKDGRKWKTRSEAAQFIKDDVISFARQLGSGVSLIDHNFERYAVDVMREIPNLHEYFTRKIKKG